MINLRAKKFFLSLLVGVLIIVFTLLILSTLSLKERVFKDDYSTVIRSEEGEILRVFLNSEEQYILPPSDKEVPMKLKESILVFEDKRYYQHNGVDIKALTRAIFQNTFKMKRVSGASTITMQVARMSKNRKRTIWAKLVEMIYALRLERSYDKEEILKLYINHAPYGGNIRGYRAATYRYYGKEPSELTWAEAVTLAVLPNAPGLINPDISSKTLKKKRDNLLEELYNGGKIDFETLNLAKAEDIPKGQIAFNFYAPHFTRTLYKKYKGEEFNSTISLNLQKRVKEMINDYMKIQKSKGVNNCAVLIADTESGEIKAYFGSQDYFDDEYSGKVDGVQARRSTGSTIKPFLYALSIDEGIISKASIVEDLPQNYNAYTPFNSNRKFYGKVSVERALQESLNAPAIYLLSQYGVENFYNFLKEAGLSSLNENYKYYGLPLVLGGAEISLLELSTLYRALGNNGEFQGLKWRKDEKLIKKKLISSESSYEILNILKELKRPGREAYWQNYDSNFKIAWKTGTSYGNRDAWTMAVSKKWTIGVWLGNFNGSSINGLSGIKSAAPLVFRIYNSLEKDKYNNWFEQDKRAVKKIKVSKFSGYALSKELEDLTECIEVDYPKEAKALRKSKYEELFYTNLEGSEEVCSLCWEQGDIKKSVKVKFFPLMNDILKKRGDNSFKVLPHKKGCKSLARKEDIKIVYPATGGIIELPKTLKGKKDKLLMKTILNKREDVFWYLDEEYIAMTKNKHELEVNLEEGWHKLYVLSEGGSFDEVKFFIK